MVSVFYALTIVAVEISIMPFGSLRSFWILVGKWAVISVCASSVIGLISFNRYVFVILWPIIYILSAIAAYFIVSIGSSITSGVVDLAFANGFSVWTTLISGKLILIIITSIIITIFVSYWRWRYVTSSRLSSSITFIGSIAVLAICLNTSSSLRLSVTSRLPLSIYYSFKQYYDTKINIAKERNTYDNIDVSPSENAPDIYVILGESLRADHLPQNGYHRNTMPIMSMDSALVSFPNIVSEAWYTHASIPIIMTDTDSLTRDNAYSQQSFISLFNKAGYSTVWFANQDMSPSYKYFANEADTLIYCNNVMSVHSYSKYLDTDILPLLETWRSKHKEEPRLAIIHAIGSHWWYKSHYPDLSENFTPEIDSHDVGSMSHEQMINSYDNTILETDRFLAGMTKMLRGTNSVVLFISDHGENLGENGKYLHTVGLDATKHPACMIWYSEEFARLYPEMIKKTQNNALKSDNTDKIFNTVIELAGLKTSVFNPKKSLLYED